MNTCNDVTTTYTTTTTTTTTTTNNNNNNNNNMVHTKQKIIFGRFPSVAVRHTHVSFLSSIYLLSPDYGCIMTVVVAAIVKGVKRGIC
jgi:hypothetical protein